MNVELLMGGSRRKAGAGKLFAAFGEPDVTTTQEENHELIVELNGVDVYDPTTGEVRSNDTGQIALWMIDTNYDGDSFFVRHCYFTGGGDPYKRLKIALKAEIDADAWASLYSTRVRPAPEARDRPGRRQGHQRLRRRGHEGLRSRVKISAARSP